MTPANIITTDIAEAKALLLPRDPAGHKGTFGHGLIVAGCKGMAGAAILSARAALRSGIGKLTVHTAACNMPLLQTAVPEAVVSPDKTIDTVSNLPDCQGFDAVAVGPGLGQSDTAHTALFSLLRTKPKQLVVDADGLNLLATSKYWPSLLPEDTILTPHPGEWQRLAAAIGANEAEAIEAASEIAERHTLYIIIKGHRSTLCTPHGTRFVNTTGNNGMATAGSGDVLTGIILSLCAQGYAAEKACRLGMWLHGKAGDLAAELLTPWAMTASDITANLPKAFKEIEK